MVTVSSFSNVNAAETGAQNIGVYDSIGISFIEDVAPGTEYIYLAQGGKDEGLIILSLDDPTNPTVVGTGNRDSAHTVMCVDVNDDETIAVIGASIYLYVFDISDKSNPIRNSSINLGSTLYDVEIDGDYVYLAGWSTGLPIVDISDINNPEIFFNGKYKDHSENYVKGIYLDLDRDYIYGAAGSSLFIYQLNSSGIPEVLSIFPLINSAWSVEKISNTQLAVSDSYGYVYFVDITDPNSPSELGYVDIGGQVNELYYSSETNKQILAADYADGLNIVDFSDATDPQLAVVMATTTDGARGLGVTVFGQYALLAAIIYGLLIYNLDDCLEFGSSSVLDAIEDIPGFNFIYIGAVILLMGIILIYKNKVKIKKT